MGGLLSAVPVWVLAVAAMVLGIFVVLFVIGFRQGREVSLWPPRIGSRHGEDVGPVQSTAPPVEQEEREPHALPQGGDGPVPGDGWRRNAVVDHDRLFGVNRLIESVAAAVSSSSANWVVSLFGDGGIGKTTAAYEATARCAEDRRFSRIAWASATNVSLARLTGSGAALGTVHWLDLVRSIAEQAGVELGLSRTLWERELAERVAGLGSQERILTVVDNLESTEDAEGIVGQLEALGLVRPHKVIVTTRWSIQAHSSAITEFAVKNLGRADAVDLIRHLGRGDRDLDAARFDALEPVLAVTEGNPFLIKLVVKHYLATHRSFELIMAELTDLRSGTGGVGAGLGEQVREHLYVRSLTELADRFGREIAGKLMSAFCTKDKGGAFSSAELAAVSGIPEPAIFDQVLECACRLALVRSSDMNRSYSIHSLLHEFTCRRT